MSAFRNAVLAVVIAPVAGFALGCGDSAGHIRARAATPARVTFERGLDSLADELERLSIAIDRPERDRARLAFRDARAQYKRVEALLNAYASGITAALNGPLETGSDDRPAGPLGAPAGFQIVEAAIFPGGTSPGPDSLHATVRAMQEAVHQLRGRTTYLDVPTDAVVDALRLEIARVVALGLAGFDSFQSGDAGVESAAALEGSQALARAAGLGAAVDSTLGAAAGYLRAHPRFASLDRLEFIVRYATPAWQAVAARRAALPPPPPLRRLWRQSAVTFFAPGAFDASAYAPDFAVPSSPALVALGFRLFRDPRLSGPGTRSCATCHDPARAFTDGRAHSPLLARPRPPAFARNTPTLWNAGFEPALFDDARAASLERQAELVLASPTEMGGSADLAAARLRADSSYRAAFARVFGQSADSALTGRAVRVALAAYVRSLRALDSRFDRAARGDTGALTEPERRGFTVFMGKGRCGTCHFLPLFNGTMPPDFVTSEPEIIGVPVRPAMRRARVDPDPGRGAVDHEPTHDGAFKVPTLRNIALTAPYMHNGAFTTLAQVIDFYNRGGGSGVGARVPGQTLGADSLGLSPAERRDLEAFLRALTDTVAAPDFQ
jgi:cytochrome c peroxidase